MPTTTPTIRKIGTAGQNTERAGQKTNKTKRDKIGRKKNETKRNETATASHTGVGGCGDHGARVRVEGGGDARGVGNDISHQAHDHLEDVRTAA
jgi:hypothetical protein